MREFIVNLGSNKGNNNDDSSPQLSRINNSLIIIVFDINERYFSNSEGKYGTREVRTSLVNST